MRGMVVFVKRYKDPDYRISALDLLSTFDYSSLFWTWKKHATLLPRQRAFVRTLLLVNERLHLLHEAAEDAACRALAEKENTQQQLTQLQLRERSTRVDFSPGFLLTAPAPACTPQSLPTELWCHILSTFMRRSDLWPRPEARKATVSDNLRDYRAHVFRGVAWDKQRQTWPSFASAAPEPISKPSKRAAAFAAAMERQQRASSTT